MFSPRIRGYYHRPGDKNQLPSGPGDKKQLMCKDVTAKSVRPLILSTVLFFL